MAAREIRQYVMQFEPDKCRACGCMFNGIELLHNNLTHPDVKVTFDCGSYERFGTFVGTPEQARGGPNITGLHVGDGSVAGEYIYLTRSFEQKGDCFQLENRKLKKEATCAQERIDRLEAEDRLSKERLRMLLPQLGYEPGENEKPI